MEPKPTSPNTNKEEPEALVAEGRRWLELLGLQELADAAIVVDGRQYRLEEFPLAYSAGKYMERVHPLLFALEKNPDNEELKSGMKKIIKNYYETYKLVQ